MKAAVPNYGHAPLLGHNLVRLLYLDEAGTDFKSPHLCVAGVIVHGDKEWPEIDRRINALVEQHIPEKDRIEFFFHAKDIFHGAKYFDRRKPEWKDQDKRVAILNDLAAIIEELHLPVVCGNYEKDKYGIGIIRAEDGPQLKGSVIHTAAAMDCLLWADRWLAEYSPSELATVVHEDGAQAKRIIKQAVRVLRRDDLMASAGLGALKGRYGLPLKRIIDTVHFADKPGATPLQLADLCAFIIGRALREQPIPSYCLQVIWRHMRWRQKDAPPPNVPDAASSSKSEEQLS